MCEVYVCILCSSYVLLLLCVGFGLIKIGCHRISPSIKRLNGNLRRFAPLSFAKKKTHNKHNTTNTNTEPTVKKQINSHIHTGTLIIRTASSFFKFRCCLHKHLILNLRRLIRFIHSF